MEKTYFSNLKKKSKESTYICQTQANKFMHGVHFKDMDQL